MNEDADRVDFAILAQHNEEFRKHLITTSDGKGRINWNSPEALKALTAATLDYKFNIKWDIPLNTLCPPVPNRATYVRWISKLLGSSRAVNTGSTVKGIDVGTGASCIYPLLGKAMFGYHFLATDTDPVSLEWAKKNITSNGWEDAITTKLQTEPTAVLSGLLNEGEQYDFVVCNPPFFDKAERQGAASEGTDVPQGGHGVANPSAPRKDRTTNLTAGEHSTEGGEAAFVGRMIDESLELRTRVTWYSAMIGRKQSLTALRKTLESLKDVSIRCTNIMHGKTTRWLLAWTFHKFDVCTATVADEVEGQQGQAASLASSKRAISPDPEAQPPPPKKQMVTVTALQVDTKGICTANIDLSPGVYPMSIFKELASLLSDMGASEVTSSSEQMSAIVTSSLISDPGGGGSGGDRFKMSVRTVGRNPGPKVVIGFALHLPGMAKPMPNPPSSFVAFVELLIDCLGA